MMKTAKLALKKMILVSLAALLLLACNKEGPQGIPGPPGPAGAVGPAGKNGAVFLTGDGAPDAKTGNVSDYYLDKKTGDLYGPKTAEGWGDPFTLAGNQNGIILSGDGKPDITLGMAGDFYLDTTGYLLYGPKLSTGDWGPALMLKGAGNNSGVTAYVISNPYAYFTDFDPSGDDGHYIDYGLSVYYDPGNNFDLWNAVKNNNMIAVYLKRNLFSYDNEEADTEVEEVVSANSTLEGTPEDYNYYLGSHYAVMKDALNIYFDNYVPRRMSAPVNNASRGYWDGKEGFETQTAIHAIIIFVIQPAAVSGLPSLNRSGFPGKNKVVQQLVKPYLE